jgi:hypothetical protein
MGLLLMMMILFFFFLLDSMLGLVKNEKSRLYCFPSRNRGIREKDDDGETSFTASNIKP